MLHILQQTGLKQIDETTNSEGEPFSVTLELEGSHTLSALRQQLKSVFIPSALCDMQRGKYQALFINPQEVDYQEKCADSMYSEVIIASLVTGERKHYLDSRDASSYGPSCFHTHQRSKCATTMGMLDGTLPTLFVRNTTEFMDVMNSQQRLLESFIPDLSQNGEPSPPISTALDFADALSVIFPRIPHAQRPGFLAYLSQCRAQLTDKIERIPQIGAINIFAGSVIHCANPDALKAGEAPGELLGEFV